MLDYFRTCGIQKMNEMQQEQSFQNELMEFDVQEKEMNSDNQIGVNDSFCLKQETVEQVCPLETPQLFFLKLLLPLMNCIGEKTLVEQTNSEDYFVCLSGLIKSAYSSSSQQQLEELVNWRSLFECACGLIQQRPILELRCYGGPKSKQGWEIEDRVLCGMLILCQTFIEIKSELKGCEWVEGRKVVEQLFDYLFELSEEQTTDGLEQLVRLPKCKSKSSRKHAFNLLYAFCMNCPKNYELVIPLLERIVNKIKQLDIDQNNIELRIKEKQKFVGLKNLGCTCYLNSLVQQLYMIDDFKNGILNSQMQLFDVNAFKSEELALLESNNTLNEHALFQLMSLFGHLNSNLRQYVIPTKFINSIRGYDNQPINYSVQQDVNEFFNLLCDKLEQNLKSTRQENLLQDIFGGLLAHKIISLEEEYPYIGEREEPYYTLPLEIKNQSNIYMALDSFIKGEILSGNDKFFCEQYNKKISVKKICCLKTLPNTLIISLKRFEFDYNRQQRLKVNDYFEFPTELNLKKWTLQGIQEIEQENEKNQQEVLPTETNETTNEESDDYFQYNLTGVIVHSGTADAGHYYSFIKIRNSLQFPFNEFENQQDAWFEFNDVYVKQWDIENLKNECFGGEYDNQRQAPPNFFYEFDSFKNKNAYLLFYERKSPRKSQLLKELSPSFPKFLQEMVWRDNFNCVEARLIYDQDFFNFFKDFVSLYEFVPNLQVRSVISYNQEQIEQIEAMYKTLSLDEKINQIENYSIKYYLQSPQLKMIKMALSFFYEILIKSKDGQSFCHQVNILKPLFDINLPACFWLIQYLTFNKTMLTHLVFELVNIEKNTFAKLLTIILHKIFKIEEPYLFKTKMLNNNQQQQQQQQEEKISKFVVFFCQLNQVKKSCFLRFLDKFCSELIELCQKYPKKTQDYYQILKYLFQLSQKVIHYIINETQTFKILFAIFIQTCSQQKDIIFESAQQQRGQQIGLQNNLQISTQSTATSLQKLNETKLIPLLDVLGLLIKGSVTKGIKEIGIQAPTSIFKNEEIENQQPMPQSCLNLLIDKTSLRTNYQKYFIPMQQFSDVIKQITLHLSWGDIENSKFFLKELLEFLLDQPHWKLVDYAFIIIDGLIKIEDKYQKQRIEYMFQKQLATLLQPTNIIQQISISIQTDQLYSLFCIKWIAEIGSSCPPFAEFMRLNSELFLWMVKYLQSSTTHILNETHVTYLPIMVNQSYKKLIQILEIDQQKWCETNEEENKWKFNGNQIQLSTIEPKKEIIKSPKNDQTQQNQTKADNRQEYSFDDDELALIDKGWEKNKKREQIKDKIQEEMQSITTSSQQINFLTDEIIKSVPKLKYKNKENPEIKMQNGQFLDDNFLEYSSSDPENQEDFLGEEPANNDKNQMDKFDI